MYPYMNHNYGQTFQGPGPRPVAPRAAGGGNPENAARVAAVMQGRTYTPQQPLPMDAGPSRVRSLADDYQRQINKANRANESRYQDILGQYNQREQDAMKQANLVRDQRYRDESARIQNDLTSRGLANSSLLGKDLFKSYERNAQYPLAVQLQTSGDKLGFMERRNDVGPDPAMLLQLAAQQGQTDQFKDQNLQQTVGEIGQAVDQRVAQQNAPQPNRLVNLPVMGAPIYGGGMGGYPIFQQGYPQQMYQGPPMQVGAQPQMPQQAPPQQPQQAPWWMPTEKTRGEKRRDYALEQSRMRQAELERQRQNEQKWNAYLAYQRFPWFAPYAQYNPIPPNAG